MRIRKLELHGFKSFPERTALHFGAGLSCVVGPNGCGKSNIVDALKWVIGEQSAKSLRGEDMQDVIFAGSTERAAVGFAEVSLVFSSEGGEPFPGEYARLSEIEVGRRLYRDGTSDYLLNQQKVRRKDVIDLFLDTGVGNTLYAFIEQGRIGEIVQASPERRRLLIDEAAGISRYKARRDEAQQQLEQTAQQLDRAADVADEMERRMRALEIQALRAVRFRRLRARIRQGELFIGLAKYADLAHDRRAAQKELAAAREGASQADRDTKRRDADLLARRAELEAAENAAAQVRDEIAEVDGRVRDLEGAVAFAAKSSADLQTERDRSAGERDQAQSDANLADRELESLANRLTELQAAKPDLELRSATATAALESAIGDRGAARKSLEGEAAKVAALVERVASARARREETERRALAVPVAREKAQQILVATRTERDQLLGRQKKLRDLADQRRAEHKAAQEATRQAVTEADAAKSTEAAARAELELATRADAAAQSEIDAALKQAAERVRISESDAKQQVQRAEADADRSIRAATATADAAADRLRTQIRQELQQAESRGSAFVAAAEAEAQALVDCVLAETTKAAAEADRSDRERTDAAQRKVRSDTESAESAARASAQQAITAATESRNAIRSAIEAARKVVADAERALAAIDKERLTVDARRQALQAAEAEDARRSTSSDAILRALGAAPPVGAGVPPAHPKSLLDLLPIPDDSPWAPAVLDDRLTMPIATTSAQIRAAAAAVGKGRAEILWLRATPTLQSLVPTALVDDLDAAIAHHERTGEPVIAKSTGERIDADGVVRLGRRGESAAIAVQRRRDLATTADRLAALTTTHSAASAALADARRAQVQAESQLPDADRAVRSAEDRGRTEIQAALDVATTAGRTVLAALQSEIQRDRQSRDQSRSAQLVAARARGAQISDLARSAVRAATATLRESAESRIEAARVDSRSSIEAAQKAATQTIAAARSSTEAAILAARADESALRAQSSAQSESRRAALAGLRATAESARKLRESRDGEATNRRSAQFAAEVAANRADGDVTAATAAEDRLKARIAEIEAQIHALSDEEQRLSAALVLAAAETSELLLARESADSARLAAEAALRQAEDREGRARSLLAEADVARAAHAERLTATRSAHQAATQRRTDAEARRERTEARLQQLDADRSAAEAHAATLATDLLAAQAIAADAHAKLATEREKLAALRKAVREAELGHRDTAERHQTALRAQTELEGRVREIQLEIDALNQRLDERYQASLPHMLDRLDKNGLLTLSVDETVASSIEIAGETLEAVQPLPIRPADLTDEEVLTARIEALDSLRNELSVLGDVNLGAVDEHREVAGRFSELAAQRADLESSVGTIREAIAKLNHTCRDRFRDAFDRVNANFQAAYPRLVGGGSARLALTSDEDLLDAGVEIFVQPPGKRLQNLALLSGGEKAMAAISLLIALFQVRPSPFCVLDEVDAPLDEANGARFNEILREMSSLSQFLVITHNRKTMEAADTLYGITMPTPGVSRLVSVRVG